MMSNTDTIEIPRKKIGSLMMVIGSALAMIFIFDYVVNPNNYESPIYAVFYGLLYGAAALFSIVFFGKKLLIKTPGLIINSAGIVCNIDLAEIGVIAWSDISSIQEKIVKISMLNKDRVMVVLLKNTETYIQRQPHTAKQTLMRNQLQQFGSPIIIRPADLKINYHTLKQMLDEKMKVHKKETV
jgi:hypothetical protein